MEVLKTFPLGQYIPADSLLHKLDAKAKILASFWLIVFIIFDKAKSLLFICISSYFIRNFIFFFAL